MKTIVTALILSLGITYATTHDDIHVELNYDQATYQKSKTQIKANKLKSKQLDVKIEYATFPSKSDLAKKQKKKFMKALSMLKPVLNSAEFKAKVLSYKRPGADKPGYVKSYLWNNKDELLSPQGVYDVLMKAQEKMIPNSENVMNVNAYVKVCKFYEKPFVWCQKVIGSTSPSSSKYMKLNWNFYKKFDTHQMLSNIVHEWIHLLGFLHGPSSTMRYEVPYVVGAIAGEVAKNMLLNQK